MGVIMDTMCYVDKCITMGSVVLVSNYIRLNIDGTYTGYVINRVVVNIHVGEGIDRSGIWRVKQLNK